MKIELAFVLIVSSILGTYGLLKVQEEITSFQNSNTQQQQQIKAQMSNFKY